MFVPGLERGCVDARALPHPYGCTHMAAHIWPCRAAHASGVHPSRQPKEADHSLGPTLSTRPRSESASAAPSEKVSHSQGPTDPPRPLEHHAAHRELIGSSRVEQTALAAEVSHARCRANARAGADDDTSEPPCGELCIQLVLCERAARWAACHRTGFWISYAFGRAFLSERLPTERPRGKATGSPAKKPAFIRTRYTPSKSPCAVCAPCRRYCWPTRRRCTEAAHSRRGDR